MTKKKKLAILGSTGSIGTQALEVISEQPESFEVEILTAYANADLLIQQAILYQPNSVVIGKKSLYKQVQEALAFHDIKVYAGEESIEQIVESTEIDLVLTAMVGAAGLKPTIRAIKAGKAIALANKETLVVAGDLITALAREKKVPILPVDSEHSAIFQCLTGECNDIEKIILTGSGGPFRGKKKDELISVTKEQALKHPTWTMGHKITIDSASLMNKGLEVIEAKWLFDVAPEQIDVLIHPQSIIHSMVQFTDGSVKAQLGLPDMKLPIQYAFGYPYRLSNHYKRLDLSQLGQLTFEKPDTGTFRNLALAYEALRQGGNMPCIMNAANEVAVEDFLNDRGSFLGISDTIEKSMLHIPFIKNPTLEDLLETDVLTRKFAKL